MLMQWLLHSLKLLVTLSVVSYISDLDLLITRLPRRNTIFYGFLGACVICCLYNLLEASANSREIDTVIITQVLLIGVNTKSINR